MDKKIKSEEEMSMDEILSSIRTLIAEDKGISMHSTFGKSVEENTNPSGARSLADIPIFDSTDTFRESDAAVASPIAGADNLPSSAVAPLDQVVFEPTLEGSSLEKQRKFSESARDSVGAVKAAGDIFSELVMRQEVVEDYNQERSSSIRNIVQFHSEDPMSLIAGGSLREESPYNTLDDLIERLVLQRVEGILERKIDTVVERIITQKLGALLSKV